MTIKKISLFLLLTLSMAQAAYAERWEAKCTDGKNLHYLQEVNGQGYLYLTVRLPNNEQKVFPFARVSQTFFNGEAICGEIFGGLRTKNNTPVTQFCANRVSRLIYLKYQDPALMRPLMGGKFCDADVIIR